MHSISFDIGPGEILGVVGESGAGKSLTGAAVIGLIDPPGRIAHGEIRLAGRRIDNLPYEVLRTIRGREIGAIFQDPFTSLDPLFPVGDQLVETLRAHLPLDRGAARERAIRLLADVGLPSPAERFEHYPHQLSGGMRQRVVIALALAAEPPLVVADECTTALDVSTQAQIVSLLARLVEAHGVSVLLITHDLGVVGELATEVAIMYAGRIVERAPSPGCSGRRGIRTPGRCSRRCRGSARTAAACSRPSPARCRGPESSRPDARFIRAARGPRTAAGASVRRWSRTAIPSWRAGTRSRPPVAEPFLALRGLTKHFEVPRPLLARVV